MKKIILFLFLSLFAAAQSSTTGGSATGGNQQYQIGGVWAAPNGVDGFGCTVNNPCTLQGATTFISSGTHGNIVTVSCSPGAGGNVYYLTAPWNFTSANSGVSAANPYIYQPNPGCLPVISGGKKIAQPWSIDNTVTCAGCGPAYFTDLDSNQFVNFEGLFYNGVRRWRTSNTDRNTYLFNANTSAPNTNGTNVCVSATSLANANNDPAISCNPAIGLSCVLSQTANTVPEWLCNAAPNAGQAWYQAFNRFRFSGTDIVSTWHGIGLGDIEIDVFERWTMSRMRLCGGTNIPSTGCKAVDTVNNIATLTGPTAATVNQGFFPGSRYKVEGLHPKDPNVALGPQQWYLDRCIGCGFNVPTPTALWRLWYIASPGENPNLDLVVVPQLPKIMLATGLQNVTFKGLIFEQDNWKVGPFGLGEQQNMFQVSSALEIDGVAGNNNIVMDGCTVRNTMGWAIRVSQ